MSWLWLLPLLSVTVGGAAMMVIDSVVPKTKDFAVLGFLSLLLATFTAFALWDSGLPSPTWLQPYVANDGMALLFDMLICGGGALSILIAGDYLGTHKLGRGEFYVLMMFSIVGAMILARATHALSLFIGLETMSLGIYALVAFRRLRRTAIEAAIKYFFQGAFASAFLLFGFALLYNATGELDFARIAMVLQSSEPQLALALIAFVFIFIGLLFKLGITPFHAWVPDAYEGALTPVTATMSVVVKTAAAAVIMRVLVQVWREFPISDAFTGWPPLAAGLALVSMLVGNAAALWQQNIKRLMAYSSIAHAGYLLLAIAVFPAQGVDALATVPFYVGAYVLGSLAMFGALVAMGANNYEAVVLDDLRGVGRAHPWVALPWAIGSLSLMGFPPMLGFLAKYYLFSVALEAGGLYQWVAIAGIFSSCVGAVYYLRLVMVMFQSPVDAQVSDVSDEKSITATPRLSPLILLALLLACVALLALGIKPGLFLEYSRSAVTSLVP